MMNPTTHAFENQQQSARRVRKRPLRRGFILLLVLVVVTIASLAALNFSASMLNSNETSQITSARLQARMCAESGAQSVRRFLAYVPIERTELGGTWENDIFYARNVMPSLAPEGRGNFSIVAPGLDEVGNYSGIRFGLQNESAKLNLNTLAQLDSLVASGDLAGAAIGGDSGGGEMATLASEAMGGMSSDIATQMLMALPGMTVDVADSILDWLDEDEEPRAYGAEFADYYQQLQPAYKPANGPINSIEQLLLVRGVTPQMLFGFDTDRNGFLDQAETQTMNNGGVGAGIVTGAGTGTAGDAPPPLGWAAYLTIHSLEKNVSRDGLPRININSDDLETLYADLSATLGNEDWATFIIAYRFGGQSGGGETSPLVTLMGMAAADASGDPSVMDTQLSAMAGLSGGGGPAGGQGGGQGGGEPQPWSPDLMDSFDLTQSGGVKFNQVLDLIDATVTITQGNNEVTFASPLTSLPGDLAFSTPVLMDLLTTVDAEATPGRINIMECPQEILRGIPGLTDEVVDQILAARSDGSDSETRNFETWLAVEGYLTMEEMRAILPLVTCGGDVFKAQVIGYLEGNAAFSRIEAIVSGAGPVPKILFFRCMDHLQRGFDIATLGQRFDATQPGGSLIQ